MKYKIPRAREHATIPGVRTFLLPSHLSGERVNCPHEPTRAQMFNIRREFLQRGNFPEQPSERLRVIVFWEVPAHVEVALDEARRQALCIDKHIPCIGDG